MEKKFPFIIIYAKEINYNIFLYINHRVMYYSLLDLSRQGTLNDSHFMSLTLLDKKLFVFYCFLFFRYLSILEICADCHSTHLIMGVPTSYITQFSNHRMTRYFSLNILLKMKFFTNFANFDMQRYQGVSPSIDCRDMYYSLLDSSHQVTSNDSYFMSLALLDEKLFVFYYYSFF